MQILAVYTTQKRPDGQDIFKGNIGTSLKRQIYNSAMTYGTQHLSKEQASSRTNKDGNEYVKHHIPGGGNIWVKEKVTDVIEQVRRREWTRARYVSRIRDNRCVHITTWKPYESKRSRGRPARRWRDELDDYWKGTIWQRIA